MTGVSLPDGRPIQLIAQMSKGIVPGGDSPEDIEAFVRFAAEHWRAPAVFVSQHEDPGSFILNAALLRSRGQTESGVSSTSELVVVWRSTQIDAFMPDVILSAIDWAAARDLVAPSRQAGSVAARPMA